VREYFLVANLALALALLGGMLALQGYGRRLALRVDPAGDSRDARAAQGAVFALLGLLLAFTFSGALQRFDERRHLIVEEANDIGTAWYRIDLLPPARQSEMRVLFRQYMDARIQTYSNVTDATATNASLAKGEELQRQIWATAVAGADETGKVAPYSVLLPALNDMFDITTTRTAVTQMHPPAVVYGMILVLAAVGAVFSGYALGGGQQRSWVHRLAFPLATAVALFVIVDMEFPRLGLIRVDAMDYLMNDLRKMMG
jgi:hypothetical protein